MKKLSVIGASVLLALSGASAMADPASSNGQGEGKGKAVADAVSAGGVAEKGGASVANTATGGWGQASGIAEGGSFDGKNQ